MKRILFILLPVILFALTGCINLKTTKIIDGGVFKSQDRGYIFEQKVFVGEVNKRVITIAHVNVVSMAFDPKDSRTLYLATRENGLYLTYNGGEKWQNIFSLGGVSSFILDPETKKIVYLASGNQIFKTKDEGRNWDPVYLETRSGVGINALAIKKDDPSQIYAGTSVGEILLSTNFGLSWKVLYNFQNSIQKILINPKDTGIIYVATLSQGIWKSQDGGKNWVHLKENLKDFNGSLNYKALIFDPSKTDALIYASSYGLLKSQDGGSSWTSLKLLTPPGAIEITSLALNPKNPEEIYYGTKNALYRTLDGGKNWITHRLPSSGAAFSLLIDFYNPNIIYLGVAKIK